MVGGPSRRPESGRGTILQIRKWSGDPSGGPEVVGGPLGGAEVIGEPSQWSGSGRGTLSKVRK